MALIHQLNEVLRQMNDKDLTELSNVVAFRGLIARIEDTVGHANAVLFVSGMEIKLLDGLHETYPEAFEEMLDRYAKLILELYVVAQSLTPNRDLVRDVFIGMTAQASLCCEA